MSNIGNNQSFKFTDLSITSAKLPFNTHLFWEHATYGLILVDADDQTKLFISTDKGDNWAEIDLSDNTNSYKIQSGWLDGNDLWLVMCDNPGDDFEVCYVELDDSNDCNPIGVSAGADAGTVYALDIFKIGTDMFVFNWEINGGSDKAIVWDVDAAPFVQKDEDAEPVAITEDEFWYGVVSGDTYYTIIYRIADIYLLYYDNSISTIGIAIGGVANYRLPTDFNYKGISFDGNDTLSFVAHQITTGNKVLAKYSITGDSFEFLSVYEVSLMLDRNNSATVPNELEKGFDTSKDANDLSRIYQIKPRKGGIIQLQSIVLAQNIIAITDNYLMFANGAVYEYTDILATNTIAEGKVNKGIFPILEKGNFNCNPYDAHLFYNDDSIKVYDESDEMVLFAKIENKSRDKDGISVFGLDAYTNELFRRSYVKTHTTVTTHEKQQDNIDNACSFCHRDSSIVATATDYSYEQDRPPMAMFSLGRFMERQVGSASPNGLVRTEAYDGLTKAPQYYKATYNFKDEVVGTSGTDIGFVDVASLYDDGACEIVSNWQGHKKVLRLQDDATVGEDPTIYHSETQATAGTREFFVGTNDVTEDWHVYLYDSSLPDYIVRLRIIGSNLQYRDNADVWQTIQAAANNTLYHVKVIWRADNTFDVWVDGTLKVDNVATNNNMVSGPDRFYMRCEGDSTDYLYFDAYGDPDNDANYNVGDNAVGWNVEVNGSIDLINISRDKPSYYVKKLGITRATCGGAVGVSQTYAVATLEDGKSVVPLKEYRDLKIQADTEALQIATALFNVFSKETKFIGIRVVDQEYVQPGYTVNFSNTGDITIAEGDYLVLFYTYDWVNDVYDLMILTDNIALLREFDSYFDRSNLMTHQNSTAVRENATDIATKCVMATDTYVGNGVNNRQIPLGFTPKHMEVYWFTSSEFYSKNDQMGTWIVWKQSTKLFVDNYLKFITDGFEVDNNDDGLNWSGHTYYYTAWG